MRKMLPAEKISALLEKAKCSPRPKVRRRGTALRQYEPLFPIVEELVTRRGYSLSEAVRWLVQNRAVNDKESGAFYQSLWRQRRIKRNANRGGLAEQPKNATKSGKKPGFPANLEILSVGEV